MKAAKERARAEAAAADKEAKAAAKAEAEQLKAAIETAKAESAATDVAAKANAAAQAAQAKATKAAPAAPKAAPAAPKVAWATNKRLETSKFKFKFPRARNLEVIGLVLGCIEASKQGRPVQILQINTRWKALAEICTMHSFAPFLESTIEN